MADKNNGIYGPTARHIQKMLWLILPVLLVFVSITSFIAGMNMNHTSDEPMGQVIDTIILSPNQKVQTITISGQVKYSDGTPYADRIIEMHSEPMRTMTDRYGIFTFRDVVTGAHTLNLLDDHGNVISSQDLYIRRTPEADTSKVVTAGADFNVQVQIDAVEIYINIEVSKDNKIVIKKDIWTLMPDGTVINEKRDRIGTAVDFSKGIVQETAVEGTGAASFESQNESFTDNSLQIELQPTDSLADTIPSILETDKQDLEPSSEEIPESSSSAKETSAEATKPTSGDSTGGSGSTGGGSTKPAVPLDVHVSDDKNEAWEQDTTIDLFANRTGAGVDRKLLPGSKGSYEFKVTNYNEYGVSYTIKMKSGENQYLLPLRYRLKSGDTYLCGNETTWLDAEQLYQKAVVLSPKANYKYTLEWQWPYEGGNDELDTMIGTSADLLYTIIVAIQITQM